MGREIIEFADAIAHEKGIAIESVIQAIESALTVATQKHINYDADIIISVDRHTGKQHAIRRWIVVANDAVVNSQAQIALSDATEQVGVVEIGDWIEEEIAAIELGRIGATMATQLVTQKLRNVERKQIIDDFMERGQKLIYGTVKSQNRGGYIVEVGKLQAFLPKDQILPKEHIRIGDKIRACVLRVEQSNEGPRVIISRTDPEFVRALFENEVPELSEGNVEIKALAREPGFRTKIAVCSKDNKQVPVGIFVGMKGIRVQSVMNELGGERIDVIRWHEDLAQFTLSALAPAEVSGLVIDEEHKHIEVVVDETNLALAIGRQGQNVKLASQLVGWSINLVSTDESIRRNNLEHAKSVSLFISKLDVDEDLANMLVDANFNNIEEIAYVPVNELLEIDGFTQELVDALRSRARAIITAEAIIVEERYGEIETAVLALKGMEKTFAIKLFDAGILTTDDIGELATDEFVEITGADEFIAAQIIMEVRSSWNLGD